MMIPTIVSHETCNQTHTRCKMTGHCILRIPSLSSICESSQFVVVKYYRPEVLTTSCVSNTIMNFLFPCNWEIFTWSCVLNKIILNFVLNEMLTPWWNSEFSQFVKVWSCVQLILSILSSTQLRSFSILKNREFCVSSIFSILSTTFNEIENLFNFIKLRLFAILYISGIVCSTNYLNFVLNMLYTNPACVLGSCNNVYSTLKCFWSNKYTHDRVNLLHASILGLQRLFFNSSLRV